MGSELFAWWDPSDSASWTFSGSRLLSGADKRGNEHTLVAHQFSASGAPGVEATTLNGLSAFDYDRVIGVNATPGLHTKSMIVPSLSAGTFCVMMVIQNN